ncbi:GNAT family N-acetyltransferase [Streptacidiphilus sp. 4-A2]|nr:GNAT family N-acetyltransferase [Streptacidiphilus sp. 4-A2]
MATEVTTGGPHGDRDGVGGGSIGTGGVGSGTIEIGVLDEADLGDWGKAVNNGFMRGRGDGGVEFRRLFFEPGRSLAARDRGRIVGTFRSMDREITVPGGATVAAHAVTNVTVLATHRRRGLLTRMMTRDLAAAAGRGDAVSVLIAAEYQIYGRYGYGPATGCTSYSIDRLRAGKVRVPAEAEHGSIELLGLEEWRELGPELHDRYRRTRPGVIDRRPVEWRTRTGEALHPGRDWQEPLIALYRDPAGTPAGILVYRSASGGPTTSPRAC